MIDRCPNHSSKEYKRLLKYYGNKEAVYAVFIANGYELPEVPTMTEIKAEIGFRSIVSGLGESLIKGRLGIYNEKHNTRHRIPPRSASEMSDKLVLHLNFMPKHETQSEIDEILKETNKVDNVVLEYTPSDSDVHYNEDGTVTVYGEVMHPDDAKKALSYQLTSNDKKTSSSELDKFLINYLSKFGITVEQITDFKERFGVDGIAVSDLINKIISVSEGKADITTLPEEASHFIVEMLGEEHPLYKSMAKNIKESKEYEEVVKEYGELYDMDEKRLVKEAMGKVLAKHIVSKYEGKNASVLDRIINWFKNTFKNFSKTDLQKGIDDIYGKIAEGVFKDTLELKESNIKDTNKYFELDSIKKKLEDNIKVLNERAAAVAKKTASNESNAVAENLRMAAKILKGNLDNDQTKLAITMFLDFIQENELKPLMETKAYHQNNPSEIMSSRDVNEMIDLASMYNRILKGLVSGSYDTDFREFISSQDKLIRDIIADLGQIQLFAEERKELAIRKILDEISIEYIGKDGKKIKFDPDELLHSKVGDIGWVGANIMPMHSVNDEVLKMVWKIVSDIHNESYRKAIDNGRSLQFLQSKMEAAGFKDMTIFKEKDENGDETGFLMTDKNWGIYNRELEAVKERVRKALGRETYYEIVYDQLSGDEQKLFKNEWQRFAGKYKSWDGVQYTPNPPVNKEFAKLLKLHPTVAAYYKELEKIHIESRENLPRIYNSLEKFYMLPQIRKDDMQILAASGDSLSNKLKLIGKNIKNKWVVVSDDIGYGDQSGLTVKNVKGHADRMLPIYFTRALENKKELSSNITGMYAHFSEMAYNFNGLAKRLDDLSLIQSQLGDRSVYKNKSELKKDNAVEGTTTNEYKAMENFMKIHVFGQQNNAASVNIGDKSYDIAKPVRNVIGYIRAKNLFMNVFTMLSGAIKGNVDTAVDAVAGNYITKESQVWAVGELAKSSGAFLKGLATKSHFDKTIMLLERSGALKNMHSIFDRLDINNPLGRVTMEDVVYGMYEPFSTQIKGVYALAVYDNNRLVNGKFIDRVTFEQDNKDKSKSELDKLWATYRDKSLYNAYESKEGRLVIKDEFKRYLTPAVENRIEGLIKNRTSVMEGTLGSMDKGAAHTGIVGQLGLLHRGWLIQGATERYKAGGVNYLTGQYEEGFHRTLIGYISGFLKHQASKQGFMRAYKADLEPWQKRNLKRGTTDIAFTLAIYSLYLLANSVAEDDKEDYWAQFIAYLSTRALLEQNAFTNPFEIINIISSPSAATNTIETFYNLYKMPFKDDLVKTGVFKGQTHLEKSLWQLSPFNNFWGMQDPATKNKFIKSQQLN